MKRIVFRTVGGRNVGYGHLYRCLSLAKAISEQSMDCKILFIVNNEVINIVRDNGFEYVVSNDFKNDYEIIKGKNANLVIIDSYETDNNYLENIKRISKIMLFDDNNDIYDSAIPDILLNGNIHAKNLNYKMNSSTIFLLGTKFLVMNENYWNDSSTKNIKNNEILITTGGSDTFNLSPEILKSLSDTEFIKKIVIGPGYSDEKIKEINSLKDNKTIIIMKPNGLKDYIKNSQYVITASGSTVYEVISQKSIPIIFSLADNQSIAYKCFEKLGIQTIGEFPNVRYEGIISSLKQSERTDVEKLHNHIDGKGALRVAKLILKTLD